MYITSILHDYYNGLEKDFHEIYLNLQEAPKEKVVSEMRRNIKQQLAFTKILRALDEQFLINKTQAPFRRFFKKLGVLQDLAAERSLLYKEESKLELHKAYEEQINNLLTDKKDKLENAKELISLVSFRHASKRIKESIDRIPTENTKEYLLEYYSFLISAITDILDKQPDTASNEKLRQLLNILFYNLKLADRMVPKISIKKDYYDLLVRLNSQLTNWHNDYFTLHKIEQQIEGVEKKLIEDLVKQEKKDYLAIQSSFDALRSLMEDIKTDIYHLFSTDQLLPTTKQSFTGNKYREIKNSISQINIADGFI